MGCSEKPLEFDLPFDLAGSITAGFSLGNTAGKYNDPYKKQERCLQQFGSHSVVLNFDKMQERFFSFQSGGG